MRAYTNELDPDKPLSPRQIQIFEVAKQVLAEGEQPTANAIARHLGTSPCGYYGRVIVKLRKQGKLPYATRRRPQRVVICAKCEGTGRVMRHG